jgi:hypothetical protein
VSPSLTVHLLPLPGRVGCEGPLRLWNALAIRQGFPGRPSGPCPCPTVGASTGPPLGRHTRLWRVSRSRAGLEHPTLSGVPVGGPGRNTRRCRLFRSWRDCLCQQQRCCCFWADLFEGEPQLKATVRPLLGRDSHSSL